MILRGRGASLRSDGLEHVQECPVSGDPCPCRPGSLAYGDCLTAAKGMRWVDEHPDRYGPISLYDYCVITIPGSGHHFVQVLGGAIDGLNVDKRAACGFELPDYGFVPDAPKAGNDAREALRKSMPMCGVVDCPACLAAMKEAQ